MPNQTLVEWAGGSRVTLAIVFTDIVGSTALGVELADERMNEVRIAHFVQSRTLIAEHAGREIKTIGDSVMSVFRSVGAALDYAYALHLDPGPTELRARGIRAGIHIGAVDVIGNDIFGTEVAFAARVVHAINGAEIWMGDQAKQDIGRAGIRRHGELQWRPHNDVELKGLGTATLWSMVSSTEPPEPSPHQVDDQTIVGPASSRSALTPGTTLINGTYVIEAFLASGGMGAVYRARHLDHGTQHAIKVIVPGLASDEKVVQLFIKEARQLERINSDAIVRYQGFLRDENGARYLVMEFVDGEPLSNVLKQRRLEAPEVLALLERVGRGLVAAHQLGIVHRDISPENIILPGGDVGSAKLIDFGIVKSSDPNDLTLIGNDFAGKLSFVSPEQVGLFGGVVDPRSDIYSLGLVLAAAALGSGEKFDMGGSLTNVIKARQGVPDLSALPLALRPIIGHMLQPRPQDRPGSMEVVLEEAKSQTPKPALAPQRLWHRPRRLAVWLAGASLAAGAAVAAIILGTQSIAPSSDQVRVALARAANGYGCADLSYSISPDRAVIVSGYVGSDQDLAQLYDTLTGLRGIARLDFDVRRRSWPYCEALSLLKPLLTRGNHGATISLALPGNQAYVGNPLKLDIRAPDFDAYVYVDYFKADGKVLHLFPNDKDNFNLRPARNPFVLGQVPMRNCWTLSGEPGEQLVTLVASRKPLFGAVPRPVEDAKEYLPRLSQALAKAAPDQEAAATAFFEVRPGDGSTRSADAACAPR